MQARGAKTLALDLEGTLISNAMSQLPRPGLLEFLEECGALFPRIVMFTAVSEERFRAIARMLVEERVAPAWFADIEYVNWTGDTKDLSFVRDASLDEVVLVDDHEPYVHPGQESRWVRVSLFEYRGDAEDRGLHDILPKLRDWARD